MQGILFIFASFFIVTKYNKFAFGFIQCSKEIPSIVEALSKNAFSGNKTPAKAFTLPAENKKGAQVVFRQKSKRVTSLYNT